MILASFLRRFPDELRADFQQHYGLNLDEMGGAYGIDHAACLAAQLPKDSRSFVAADPMCEYASVTNQLLTLIEYDVRMAWYVRTEDAKTGRNHPQYLLDVIGGSAETTQGESLTIDEYMEILAKPRKEVQHGC